MVELEDLPSPHQPQKHLHPEKGLEKVVPLVLLLASKSVALDPEKDLDETKTKMAVHVAADVFLPPVGVEAGWDPH